VQDRIKIEPTNTYRDYFKFRILLQTQVLRVGQVNEPCIRLTQENSMENSVQDSLPYILNPPGPC